MVVSQTIPKIEKTGIEIIDRLREADPEKNVAILAVGRLKSRADMVRFYDAYVVYLKDHSPAELMRQSPEESARLNLLAATGYYDKRTRARWHSLISEIEKSEYKHSEQSEMLRK